MFLVESVAAFVIAGGRSSRMGSDKALLVFNGQTLLQRALAVASTVAPGARIVGHADRYAQFGPVIEDIFPHCGPLGGIHAALAASASDLNLMLSVDMPLMTSAFLAWLLQKAHADPELIVVPEANGGPQPLCAVYRPAVRPAAEQALQRGDFKIARLFAQVPTRIVAEHEIMAAGFSPDLFRNVNTAAEFKELSRQQP
jgi:molybdopterin-guanine dinucleotide biosynthesis protein A